MPTRTATLVFHTPCSPAFVVRRRPPAAPTNQSSLQSDSWSTTPCSGMEKMQVDSEVFEAAASSHARRQQPRPPKEASMQRLASCLAEWSRSPAAVSSCVHPDARSSRRRSAWGVELTSSPHSPSSCGSHSNSVTSSSPCTSRVSECSNTEFLHRLAAAEGRDISHARSRHQQVRSASPFMKPVSFSHSPPPPSSPEQSVIARVKARDNGAESPGSTACTRDDAGQEGSRHASRGDVHSDPGTRHRRRRRRDHRTSR